MLWLDAISETNIFPPFACVIISITYTMRKISKSRADDDVVSSTNGSVVNDVQLDSERQTDPEEKKEPEIESNENVEEEESTSVSKESSPKKGKAKNKSKKKKSDKEKPDKNVAEEEYEVENIIDSKRIKGKLHYLIRWKGYAADSDTWEPEHTLSCPELINKFNEEKENSEDKDDNPEKKSNKRKAKKTTKVPSKRPKNDWDGKNADKNAEYEVDRILEVRLKKNGKREFFIHWKGWASKFDSWEPESNLNCPELIKKFMEKVSKARSVDARDLRVTPSATKRYTLQDPSSGRRLSKRRGQRQRVRYDDAE